MDDLNKRINDNQWNKFAEPYDSLQKQEDPKSETNHNLETGAMKQTAPKSWDKTVSSKSARKLNMPNRVRILYGLPKKELNDDLTDYTDISDLIDKLYYANDEYHTNNEGNFLKFLDITKDDVTDDEWDAVSSGEIPNELLRAQFGERDFRKLLEDYFDDYVRDHELEIED